VKLVIVEITTAFGGVTVSRVDTVDVEDPFGYVRENYLRRFKCYGDMGDFALVVVVED